jgi:hypothetical protein
VREAMKSTGIHVEVGLRINKELTQKETEFACLTVDLTDSELWFAK